MSKYNDDSKDRKQKCCRVCKRSDQPKIDDLVTQYWCNADYYPENLTHLCQVSRIIRDSPVYQEPITRSLQLPYISVTAFSQTDLFLVWIYLEFRSQQEPHWPIAVISTN